MKHRCLACVLVALLLYSTSRTVHALGFASRSLPEVITKAGVICIGTVGAISSDSKASFDTGVFTGPKTAPYSLKAMLDVADVAVESTLKGGPLPAHIRVAFAQNVPGNVRILWAELTGGERAIFFLKRNAQNGLFGLLYPFGDRETTISLGPALLTLPFKQPTLLRTILLLLTQMVQSHTDPWTRMRSLDWICSVGGLLYPDNHPKYYFEALHPDPEQARQALHETPDLEAFVTQNLLPVVRHAAHDPDWRVRGAAVQAGAALQDVTLIPNTARDADADIRGSSSDHSLAGNAYWLTEYRVPTAVRPLVSLLNYDKQTVRTRAAEALRGIADPLAVPFLLDRLSREPNADILVTDLRALHDCASEKSFMPDYSTAGQTAKSVSYWRQWAIVHKAQVDALRAQYAGH